MPQDVQASLYSANSVLRLVCDALPTGVAFACFLPLLQLQAFHTSSNVLCRVFQMCGSPTIEVMSKTHKQASCLGSADPPDYFTNLRSSCFVFYTHLLDISDAIAKDLENISTQGFPVLRARILSSIKRLEHILKRWWRVIRQAHKDPISFVRPPFANAGSKWPQEQLAE